MDVDLAVDIIAALAGTDVYERVRTNTAQVMCVLCYSTVRRAHLADDRHLSDHQPACPWRRAVTFTKEHQR